MEANLLDCIGRRRSPATVAGYHAGRPPRNKGLSYPADPPRVEEIVRVMRAAGAGPNGARLRGLIVVLWRAGLRVSEALALAESDLDINRGAILVRRGNGGKRREVGMDAWGWQQLLGPWLQTREQMPVGALFCVIHGPSRGRPWSAAAVRVQLRRAAVDSGVRRRFAPHQLRHAHAVEMAREGVPLVVIQRQLGHANLGITSIYLQGIDNAEIIDTVHHRAAPMIPATAGPFSPTDPGRNRARVPDPIPMTQLLGLESFVWLPLAAPIPHGRCQTGAPGVFDVRPAASTAQRGFATDANIPWDRGTSRRMRGTPRTLSDD